MIDMKARKRATILLAPLGRGLARIGIRAWQVTLFGLALTITGAVFIALEHLVIGGVLVLVGSGIDALDGAVARASDTVSERGAFLDAATDRIGETAMWTGLAVAVAGQPMWVALSVVCLGASLIISYLRARAEMGGADGRGGLMGWVGPMLWAMALLTWLTVGQRFWLGWKRIGA